MNYVNPLASATIILTDEERERERVVLNKAQLITHLFY